VTRALAIVGAVILVVQVAVWLPLHARRTETNMDWVVYRDAAENVLAGRPLYADCRPDPDRPPSCYLYPPPLAVALAPLAALGSTAFQAGWYALLLVAFWVYAFALVRLSGREMSLVNVLAAGALVELAPGTSISMSFGNANMLVWALCALSLSGSATWAGIGAALKVYPCWAVLARRDRSTLVGMAAGAAVLGLSALAVGPGAFQQWGAALRVLGPGVRIHGNVGLGIDLLRVAGLFGYHGAARGFLTALPLMGVPAVILATRRLPRELAGALVLVAAVALAPLCWWYYAPMLLMPAAAALRGPVGVGERLRLRLRGAKVYAT